MKKIIFFLGVVFLFTGFTSFKKVPPATVTDTHFDICGPFTDANPCTGATITTTGCYGVDIHEVVNGNRANTSIHASGHLTATDDQGNTYEVNLNEHETQNGSFNNSQFVFDEIVNLEFITKGGAPNFVEKVRFHITVNANGTVTADHSSFTTECRG